jgi:hypothetical protein
MHRKVAERYFAYGRSNSEISTSENWLDIFYSYIAASKS